MSLTLQNARDVLSSQSFSVLLNAEIVAFDSDKVELQIPITQQLMQQHGFVHGGVLSYAADNALTFAGGASLGPAVVTSEYKINYLRPAQGEFIIARARVLHAGSRQAVCQCDILCIADGRETLCAVAQGTITSLGTK